jgi:chaperonin GroES
MNLTPLSNRVILEPLEDEKVTKSGIVIPDTADKQRPVQGTVIAIGPGKADENGKPMPMSVKVGDRVLFKKYGPDEVELDGKKYLVADEDFILAIVS